MLYIFSKTDCGPCILVKKYFKTMNDPRTESVEEILLDDGQEENIELARKYSITATPTLIVVENEEKIEEYVGGVPITQNIVQLLDKYSDQLGDPL
jgi:thioredoxin-related protein